MINLSTTSRTYCKEEKELYWWKLIQQGIWVKDIFRQWEVPAVLLASGIDPEKRYLSVGGWSCSATYIIGCVAEIDTIDVNSSILDWLETTFDTKWPKGVIPKVISKKKEMPYPDNYFDVVISVSAIEHSIEDEDIETMRQIGRVLKKGGKAVITVEYWDEFIDYDSIVGGRIYNWEQIEKRLIIPSGLTLLGDKGSNITPEYVARGLIPQMDNPFCPIILILRKEK